MKGHARRQDQRGNARRAKTSASKAMPPTSSVTTATATSETANALPSALPTVPRGSTSRAAATLGQTIARTTALPSSAHTASSEEAHSILTTSPTIPTDRAPVPVEAPNARQLALAEVSAAPGVLIRGPARPPRPSLHIVPRRHGPRAPLAQFFGAMVVAIAILGTVMIATPLGQTTGLASAFQAYASAIPFIPPPTPTPKPAPQGPGYAGPPHVADPGKQAVINEIVAVFGPYAQGALAVARCESGYDPNARNPYAIGNSHASGVFQILYPSTWNGTSYARYSPYDANANIHAAYELFSRDGYTWREWQCQP